MASNAYNVAPTKAHTFQFTPSDPVETATLSELVKNLDVEVQKRNGEPVTVKTLKRTLDFLRTSIGVNIETGDESLPMSALKTAKLLFKTDLDSNRNLYSLMAPPAEIDDATMEFSTVTTIPRDPDAAKLIKSLCESLSMEIDPAKLRALSRLLGRREDHSIAEELLLYVERTNDEVSQILQEAFGTDETLLVGASTSMAASLKDFSVELIDDDKPPANEAMYVYLQTLSFRHFIQHYPKHLSTTRIRGEIGDIQQDAERFCEVAAQGAQHHHGPASRVFSVNTSHHLLLEHPEDMCELVQKATGLPTTVRQLQGHRDRVRVLLTSYAYRSFDCTDPIAKVLSVYDVIAAFCSFRYQQVAGEDYRPYWHGQVDQGKNPQRLFDKGLNDEQPYQHQGVMQIYLNRFYEYKAAFTDTIGSYRAWMRYQMAVLRAYQSVLDLKDIYMLIAGLNALNFYCINLAKDLVIDHYRKDL